MDTGPRLHDRSTRGEVLSPAEQEQLDAWYREQDEIEVRLLGLDESAASAEDIQAEIDAVLTRIAQTAARIQVISSENARLRAEVSELREQLAQQRRVA